MYMPRPVAPVKDSKFADMTDTAEVYVDWLVNVEKQNFRLLSRLSRSFRKN